MIKITIEGKQGEGKSIIAKAISDVLPKLNKEYNKEFVAYIVDGENAYQSVAKSSNCPFINVRIKTKYPKVKP